MKIINIGFMTESWNVRKNLKEADQMEMDLGDPRKQPATAPEAETKPATDPDPLNDKALVAKIKEMLAEYKKTKDKSLLRPITQEMAKLYAPEAKDIVSKFEKDPIKTTRGNYGKYMQLLSSMQGIHRAAMVFALRDAGAGRGLEDAIQVLGA